MSFQVKGWKWDQSAINLRDPDDLPYVYTRQMTMAAVYPRELESILMIGLGGGSVSTYLGRHLPQARFGTIEIDPGVIAAAKKYFGLRQTARVAYREGDGRVFLKRNPERYDLLIIDAYRGGYVPFHMLTREFYALVKDRLKPTGAVAFNVLTFKKLYLSTILTLRSVFPSVDAYPSGEGEVIAIATPQPGPDRGEVIRRATALQERYGFRYDMTKLVGQYVAKVDTSGGAVLTDDFAPAEIYGAPGTRIRKK
jgi:spermidine synthase